MISGFWKNVKSLRPQTIGWVLATVATATTATRADIVYDNLNTPLNFYAGGFGAYDEIADDVYLGGFTRVFQSVSIAYTAFDAPTDASLTLSIYQMDGAPTSASFGENTPGSLLFRQTVPLVNSLGWLATVTDPSQSILLPDHIAIGLSFERINFDPNGVDAGPLLLDPPTVGSSFPDFWIRGLNGNSNWGLYTLGDLPANFGIQITTVPDGPSSLNLWSIPLLLALHQLGRSSRKLQIAKSQRIDPLF